MMSGETLKDLTNEDIESGVSSLEFDRQKADAEREDAGIAGESHGADKGDNEMICIVNLLIITMQVYM